MADEVLSKDIKSVVSITIGDGDIMHTE